MEPSPSETYPEDGAFVISYVEDPTLEKVTKETLGAPKVREPMRTETAATYDQMMRRADELRRQLGKTFLLSTGAVSGKASNQKVLEMSLRDPVPFCPAWATPEERAWFDAELAKRTSAESTR